MRFSRAAQLADEALKEKGVRFPGFRCPEETIRVFPQNTEAP
jgi:hypothetical protein